MCRVGAAAPTASRQVCRVVVGPWLSGATSRIVRRCCCGAVVGGRWVAARRRWLLSRRGTLLVGVSLLLLLLLLLLLQGGSERLQAAWQSSACVSGPMLQGTCQHASEHLLPGHSGIRAGWTQIKS